MDAEDSIDSDTQRFHTAYEYDIQAPLRDEGGFRNRRTGIVYLNIAIQTEPIRKPSDILKFSRDAQTVHLSAHTQQTKRESGTQMVKPGLIVEEDGDKIMYPQEYFNSEQWADLLEETALTLQRWTRGWIARKRLKEMKAEQEVRKQEIIARAEVQTQDVDVQRIREIARRTHPTTKEDFDLLYAELQAWMQAETERINALGLSEEERLAALAVLLSHETRIIQTIDRLKITAKVENKEKRIDDMLEAMSAPKELVLRSSRGLNGEKVKASIHTPYTTRARELADLHKALKLNQLTIDERLDILLHVKWTVKEFDCQLTREIVDLIDREADLLNRGRPEKSIDGLRERISNLFLQFIETPAFNPEAARFLKVPKEVLIRPNTKLFSDMPLEQRRKLMREGGTAGIKKAMNSTKMAGSGQYNENQRKDGYEREREEWLRKRKEQQQERAIGMEITNAKPKQTTSQGKVEQTSYPVEPAIAEKPAVSYPVEHVAEVPVESYHAEPPIESYHAEPAAKVQTKDVGYPAELPAVQTVDEGNPDEISAVQTVDEGYPAEMPAVQTKDEGYPAEQPVEQTNDEGYPADLPTEQNKDEGYPADLPVEQTNEEGYPAEQSEEQTQDEGYPADPVAEDPANPDDK
ncbi:MAG: putative flagellar associated protein [Streblomastix strix]|uniref:Putative flagellar associated protein n=1 Tax=Streblomastix strix TaxID=222440 RepID=A0A5J4X1E8_9EUKA|nr:MAG: putative flagellar associated protein [Streblomastix strix]